MNQIKDIETLNEYELKNNVPLSSSWHQKYRSSNYIFLGGFPYSLTEGDIECLLSQFGTVKFLKLLRDSGTGDSKGSAFAEYMQWESTVLAVDNLVGTVLMGRKLRCDHVLEFEREEGDEDLLVVKKRVREESKQSKKERKERKQQRKEKKEKKKKKKEKKAAKQKLALGGLTSGDNIVDGAGGVSIAQPHVK